MTVRTYHFLYNLKRHIRRMCLFFIKFAFDRVSSDGLA